MEELNNLMRTLLDEIRSGAKNWDQQKILMAEAKLRGVLRVEPPPVERTEYSPTKLVCFVDKIGNAVDKYVPYDLDATVRDVYKFFLPDESTWNEYEVRAGRKTLMLNEFLHVYKDYAFLRMIPADLYVG